MGLNDAGVQGLAFSPNGKEIASASRDRSVRLWDLATGELRWTLGMHQGAAWCVAFAPDGKTVASGGLDGVVRFWQLDELKTEPPQPPQAQQKAQGPQRRRTPEA